MFVQERILGIDLGERRIGLALSDPLALTAQGLPTLTVKSFEEAVGKVAETARKNRAITIVVGLPLNLNGRAGCQARKAYQFGERLQQKLDINVVYWDERLSSQAAERVLLQAGLRRRRRKYERDKLAAQIILQSYLDRQKHEDLP